MDDVQNEMYNSSLELVLLDIWIVLTGVVNLVTNSLILYCLIKAKLFRPIYILIFHIVALDIIQQLFCPTVFKLFANVDDIFKDFTNHKVFTCIYFTALYFIAVLMFVLILRVQLKCLDKTYHYVLAACWILAILSFTISILSFQVYTQIFGFIPPYFLILAVLLVYVHIHQIRTTLKCDEYSGVDYQVSVLIVLTYISSRVMGMLFLLLGAASRILTHTLLEYVILGAMQLVSIANLMIIARFEQDVKNCTKCLFNTRRTRTVNEFHSLQEDHTLPE